MRTISLRISDQEDILLKEYLAINNLQLSKFIRDTILEKIEDELNLDENKILISLKEAKKDNIYSLEEVFKNV
ncbi:TPA: CopG family transcriptional regulator [Campylobacter lari]|nr:CopG family transcriptional regulator [Campylobacter lari]